MFTFELIIVLIFTVAAAVAVDASGMYGWDTSQIKDQSIIDCLKAKNDAQFIVFPAMDKYASVDPDICHELSMSASANIPHRDVSFIPCPTCAQSAEKQFSMMMDNLNNHCNTTWSRRVWLDVNSHSFWPTPWRPIGYDSNQKWFTDMVNACMGTSDVTCGILSSPDEWKYTLGSTTYVYPPANTLPLWYSSPTGVASFDDFVPFGGFTTPYAKQFVYMLGMCGASVIYQDWSPAW